VAKRAKITIEVTAGRNNMTVKYRTSGLIARLSANDVHATVVDTSLLPTSGSKAFWEAALTKVNNDIVAGHGGGT
jgi:hypothetical protein